MAKKASNALAKYQRALKKVRKEHPNMSIENARKKASSMYKKVGKPAKVAGSKPVKRSVTKTEKISTVGKKKRVSSNPVQKGISISKKINDLEILLKNTSGVKAKNNVKRRINAEHDRLDQLSHHF